MAAASSTQSPRAHPRPNTTTSINKTQLYYTGSHNYIIKNGEESTALALWFGQHTLGQAGTGYQ